MADDFDLELDIDLDNQDDIVIENVENIVNFENVSDKSVHILNLLSGNNKGIDVTRYKKYWDKKVANILSHDAHTPISFNRHTYPIVDYTKKITEQDPDQKMIYQYNPEDVSFEPMEAFVKKWQDVVEGGKFFGISFFPTDKHYNVLVPFAPTINGEFKVPNDTDVFFRGPHERTRMLAPYDNHNIIGYYNCPVPDTTQHVDFDVTKYINSLRALKIGDKVTIVVSDDKIKGTVTHNNEKELTITPAGRKKVVVYFYDRPNYFMVYASDFPTLLGKKDLFTTNVTFRAGTEEENAANISTVTANDVISSGYLPQMTLDQLVLEYPGLLDANTKNAPLSTYFHVPHVHVQSKKNQIKTKKESVKTPRRNVMNDVEVAGKIYKWLKKQKDHDARKTTPTSSSSKKLATKVFYSVDQMIDDHPTKFDKSAEAVLIVANYYKMKNKKKEDAYFEFPFCPKFYKLTHAHALDNNHIIWDVVDEIVMPRKKESVLPPSVKVADALASLRTYIEMHQNEPDMFNIQSMAFTFSTGRSYVNFQGKENFDDEYVAEFGVGTNVMDNIATDTTVQDIFSREATSQLVANMAQFIGLELTPVQVKYISAEVHISEEMMTMTMTMTPNNKMSRDNAIKLFSNFLGIFALFVIFIQIHLPDRILKPQVDGIFSFPINEDKKRTELINFMLHAAKKFAKDNPVFSQVFSEPTVKKVIESNPSDFVIKIIQNTLAKRPFLKVLLTSAMNKYRAAVDGGASITKRYPLWSTFQPRKYDLRRTTPPKKLAKRRALYLIKQRQKFPVRPIVQKVKQRRVVNETASNQPSNSQNLNPVVTLYMNNAMLRDDPIFARVYQDENHKNKDQKDNKKQKQKETGWNDMSTVLDEETDHIKTIVDKVMSLTPLEANTMLNSFLVSNVKDIFGKIVYGFEKKSEKQIVTHLDFLQDFYKLPTSVTDAYKISMKNILDNLLNIGMLSLTNPDLKYALLYIILLIFNALKSVDKRHNMIKYLVEVFVKKCNINLMSRDDILRHYQEERETKKQKLMQMYKGMEDEIRRLTKKAVDMGLIVRDDLLDADEMERRIANERDDYDMNEEED